MPAVLPSGFLGRSAPCLQELSLDIIPFPASPTLLLSARDLVKLHLHNISKTGYISPEAMVAGLAALPRLRSLHIRFRSPASRPDRICPPPPITRTVVPALTSFEFHGVCDYLEDLVAGIDCPRLNSINLSYLGSVVDFQVSQLSKFVQLFHPFTTVQTLFLYECRVGHVALVLEDVDGEMGAELLPALNLLCSNLKDQPELCFAKFMLLAGSLAVLLPSSGL